MNLKNQKYFKKYIYIIQAGNSTFDKTIDNNITESKLNLF